MISADAAQWEKSNQDYLMAAVALVREALEPLNPSSQQQKSGSSAQSALDDAAARLSAPSALQVLCASFGLSSFERDLLLLCAGPELDSRFSASCAAADSQGRPLPTFSLALAALPDAHWSALSPGGPLRRWRLIEVGSGSTLNSSPLRIDERVLHYLGGVQHLDERLAGLVEPVGTVEEIMPSHKTIVEQAMIAWGRRPEGAIFPAIQVYGHEFSSKTAVAAAICRELGLRLYVMAAHHLPSTPAEMDGLVRLWERESILGNAALLLECGDSDAGDPARERLITQFINSVRAPLIISGRERRRSQHRLLFSFDVRRPPAGEQIEVWSRALGEDKLPLNSRMTELIYQFSLNPLAIHAAAREALTLEARTSMQPKSGSSADRLSSLLWEACRGQARTRLDGLAQHVEATAGWDDLVLPTAQLGVLREMAIHVRQRATVYETWGFSGKGARGLGISALFSGSSGTGKTMAAEVLAHELRLDLYRIDLSQVVSKYIGETEKNLRRVFDAAEEGGAILLFDEADALFGKRSEVKDSHDRYANIEVSYLLQRMETYAGLAILTTNLKSSLDTAFLRRIRFIVQFPFPDADLRREIWRRVFPHNAPVEGLDLNKLARLNVTGGSIRNIALNAAFLAAETREPVRMKHLLQAACNEYVKMEQSLSTSEIDGWI
ncbi:MAG TPA: AAA family ATPase [Candidatus Angelobacter sp.]|jgi:hypothetical protein|nr:AAA family ATPase [Candidatus Angelobacter sp.]